MRRRRSGRAVGGADGGHRRGGHSRSRGRGPAGGRRGQLGLKDLQDECAQVRAAADRDPEARRRRIHAGRHLRTYTDAEGAGNLHYRDNPERVAQVMAVITPIADRIFNQARKEGRHEPPRPMGPTPWWRRCAGGADGGS